MELARLLGQRTGELHLALASDSESRDFVPEPFTPFYQRALFQSMRNLAMQNLQLLQRRLQSLPESARSLAEKVVKAQPEIIEQFKKMAEKPDAGPAHPLSWGLSSRPGALHGQRFPDH